MSLFVLDTAGDQKLNELSSSKKNSIHKSSKRRTLDESNRNKSSKSVRASSDDEDDYFGLPPPSVDLSELINSTLSKKPSADKKNQALEEINVSIDAALEAQTETQKRRHHKRVIDLDHSDFNMETGKFDDEQILKVNVTEVVANSRTLQPGFEELKAQPYHSHYKQQRLNRLERAKTKGGDWYNLPATEVTDEIQNELKILQMRSVLDPKHFYKKNDLKVLPKYFQIGTVLPSPLDHYKERDTRKNKKRSLVDELLADTEFQSFNKRKYNEVMARKNKYAQRKAMKKMKKLKKHK